VGANGIDDGGEPAEWPEMLQGHGDFFLDAPAPNVVPPATPNQGADGTN
jgi:hypothetical protein